MANDKTDASFDKAEVEKLFNKAKTSGDSYNFAFGLASKPDECGLSVHLRKPGKTLKKDLKKSSAAIRKVCFGTFTVSDGQVNLSSEKPIKGIIRQLKVRFRGAGMGKYNPILVGPDGEEIDEDSLPDSEDYDDSDAEESIGEVESEAPDLSVLKTRLVALRPAIETAPKEQAGVLGQAFTKAVKQLKDGDGEGAAATIGNLEKAMARLGQSTATPTNDATTRLKGALGQLIPRIRALASGPAQTALIAAAQQAQTMISAGDPEAALATLRNLSANLTKAEAGAAAKPPDPSGAKPLDIWNNAKEAADIGISKLQQALRGVKHPATDRLAEFGLAGLSGGGIQTKLMAALMDHARASAETKPASIKTLTVAIAAYRDFLTNEPMVAHCENNPLGIALDLRGGLGKALDQIEHSLGG